MLRRLLLGLGIVLVAIQFIRPPHNAGPVLAALDPRLAAPSDVRDLLAATCFDCHSDHTRYPWYADVQPVGWFIAHDVADGKRHLNFSAFAAYPPERAARKLQLAADQVAEDDMPPAPYRLLHPAARLTPDQAKRLAGWLDATGKRLEAPPAKP